MIEVGYTLPQSRKAAFTGGPSVLTLSSDIIIAWSVSKCKRQNRRDALSFRKTHPQTDFFCGFPVLGFRCPKCGSVICLL